MSFINRRRNSSIKKLLLVLVILVIGLSTAFVLFSPAFERVGPKIVLKDNIYWNLKEPLKINISDESGIKSYEVSYFDGQQDIKLFTNIIGSSTNSIDLAIEAPQFDRRYTPKNIVIKVNAVDGSNWNFFDGNRTVENLNIKIDKKAPTAKVIANSRYIRRGGSASVVVEVDDENLKDLYISFNNEERFELIPFYQENYYMAIIAWPIDIEEFRRVNLVAIDKANNKRVTKVPYYIQKLKEKVDNINIADSFIDKVAKDVLEKSGNEIPMDNPEIFIKLNKDLRDNNKQTIKDETRKSMSFDEVSTFDLKAFRQLKNSKSFAGYGEKRYYKYNGELLDEAWHLGMDWASTKMDKIYSTNSGKVIFKDYLGIYGNTLIIDHKYGISSLYAHASNFDVEVEDDISSKQLLGNTGSTGAVFGDHLHFGVLIQGIEVNPLEWMDKNWIKTRITNVLNHAKKVIDSK